MFAYYNEHDPFAAAWLRELIKAGHIAPGEVDERSIEDVLPVELREFTQCHFFAGIGVWSYALRQAGWPDDRPVWTGSCPCQPFSAAGKRAGTADERHLWPSLYHLVAHLRPVTLFGEQVASKDGLAWFDTVSSDLEATGYSVGAVDLCSAGFGAPHIRQRLYFAGTLADSMCSERGPKSQRGNDVCHGTDTRRQEASSRFELDCENVGPVDHSSDTRHDGTGQRDGGSPLRTSRFEQSGIDGGLANNNNTGLEGRQRVPERTAQFPAGPGGLVNGFWAGADWIWCRDGKYRPVEPGSPPLATGITNRVGKLRGYGNALTAPVAQGFIEAFLETEN